MMKIEPEPAKQIKFLLISSRSLSKKENDILISHGKLFVYTKAYQSSAKEIEDELSPTFWFFNISHKSVRDYLHKSLAFFTGTETERKFCCVCIRRDFEPKTAEWIKAFSELRPRVVKYIPDTMKGFTENLKNSFHIPIPKTFKRHYSEKFFRFITNLL